jgi:hypothetical protein
VAQSTVKLIVDAQNAIRPLQRVNEQTKALSKSTDTLKGRLDKSNSSLRSTGRAAKTASGGVRTLVGALRPLLTALAVIGTGKFVIFQTADLERQTKALTVLTGSAEEAQKIVKEIKEFGAVTPFKSSELIEVAKRMKAFGFETEQVVDMTKRVADIAGTAGADIDNVALAIGKVQAKNKFMQEENVMLLEKGINVTKELENLTGKNAEGVAEAMRKGEISADLFAQAIINLTSKGGEFFEGAQAQSDTLFGKFSTLIDGVETLAQRIGKKLEPALKGALDIAIDLITNINQAIAAGSITDADKKALKKQADEIITEQAGRFPGGPFGMGEVSIDFQGKTFKGQPASVSAQITNALINAEVAKRLKEQIAIQKKLAEEEKKLTKIKKENLRETEDLTKETQDITESFTGLIPLTKTFNESLGQTNIFVDSINQGTISFSDSLSMATSEADILKQKFNEIGQSVEQGIVSNLTDAVMGTQTLAQSAINVLNNLKRKLVEVAIQRAVSGIGGGIGGFLGKLFGGGKKNEEGLVPFIPSLGGAGFANGGNPPVGKVSLVGEKGPELFVPRSAGTVIPNNRIGGVVNNISISVDASGSSVAGDSSSAEQLGSAIASAVQAQLIKEKRPGGLLTR